MMSGDKKTSHSAELSAAGLKSDACANLANRSVIPGKVGIPSDGTLSYSDKAISSVKGGLHNKGSAEQSVRYDYRHPGYNEAYCQPDGSCHQNPCGGAYTDNGSLLYFMPSYNPYAPGSFLGVDGQQPYFSSNEGMYSWNSTYTGDATQRNPASWGTKTATGSNGSVKSNDFSSKRSMNPFNGRSSSYPLDMKSQESSSDISQAILQSQHFCSPNKPGAAYQSGHAAKGHQPCANLSSFVYQNHGIFPNYSMNYALNASTWNDVDRYKVREKSYANGESEELTCGPRAQSSIIKHEESALSFKKNQYNLDEFQTDYEHAKFYVIKSYSEDDVHKCVKYDVWSSTPNGNKKLDAAFHDAKGKAREIGSRCPVFLFFSVNGSGQFVGVAEMIGPVVFEKNMDFWQLDKWSGFFPVKWHIVKDVPNMLLRHIILESNDNRPVTYTRDTQEVGLKQGLEMLDIFKSYPAKTSLLHDLSFYDKREELLKARRASKAAFQPEKNPKSGEGSMTTNGSSEPASSIIKLTRNLSLNTNTPKDKSAS